VEHGVGRAAHGDLERDGVLEGLGREELRGPTILLDHVDDEFAGLAGHVVAGFVLGGRRGRSQRREPDRLADRGHRVGGEHAATRPRAGTGVAFEVVEFVVGHLAVGDGADALEDVLDGDLATAVFARHDRPAVQEDRGQVGADRGHHHAGHVLVTAADGDEGVHPLAEGDEFDRIGDHFPRDQRGLHPLGPHRDGVGDGDRAELDRHAAGVVDAVDGGPRHVVQVDVTGRDVRRRVGDAHHRRREVVVVEPHRPEHRPVGGAVPTRRHLAAPEPGILPPRVRLRVLPLRVLLAHVPSLLAGGCKH
jgi:hypothetical protein